MSKIAIIPSDTGTGTVSVKTPSTNTDREINLPDADGDLFLRDEIVGTVSTSLAGVPTGAIIESGSNSNGYYIKYADGTMICWFNIETTSQSIDNAYGSLYQGSYGWVFPVAFAEPPTVSPGIAKWGTSASWGAIGNPPTITSTTIRLLDVSSRASGTTTYIAGQAIGKWR
jgi:hypothetical protein